MGTGYRGAATLNSQVGHSHNSVAAPPNARQSARKIEHTDTAHRTPHTAHSHSTQMQHTYTAHRTPTQHTAHQHSTPIHIHSTTHTDAAYIHSTPHTDTAHRCTYTAHRTPHTAHSHSTQMQHTANQLTTSSTATQTTARDTVATALAEASGEKWDKLMSDVEVIARTPTPPVSWGSLPLQLRSTGPEGVKRAKNPPKNRTTLDCRASAQHPRMDPSP